MAHFAQLNDEGVVQQVHCIENRVMTDADGNESEQIGIEYLTNLHGDGPWVQTSYNTRAGEHPEGNPLRANYCGTGWMYDPNLDIFHPAQPYPSWSLNETTGHWIPPVPIPEIERNDAGLLENLPSWNEDEQRWE